MMSQENIGKFIVEARKKKNLTQEQFAEKIGVSNRSVSRWENGKTMPDISLFPLICDELEISIAELLNGRKSENKVDLQELICLMIDFFDQENTKRSKLANQYYILGYLCLGFALLHSQFGIFHFAKTADFLIGVLIGLGIVCVIAGFYQLYRRKKFTSNEISAFLGLETAKNLHTAGEMLQYAKRYQKADLKQYEKAFQAIEEKLLHEESVLFSMVADTFLVNESWTDSWKPWHISLAITNSRMLVCGEAIHGRFMTFYDVESFDLTNFVSVELNNRRIIIKFTNDTLTIEGNNLEAVFPQLKKCIRTCMEG